MSDLGNKAVFSRNLRNIMEERHVTRNQMCADLGFVYSTFSDWYNGKKYPRIDKIEMMANYFGIMKSDLIENKPTVSPLPANAIPYRSTGMAPVLGRIPAGTPALAEEYIEGYEPVDVSDPGSYYWLRVQGDSMVNAGIQSGDLVLIHMQPCAENGQIVACRVNGDEATLKRYREQQDAIILMPENPAYEPRIVSKKDFADGYAAIMGVAVEIKRKL